jgi:hypothetical protein
MEDKEVEANTTCTPVEGESFLFSIGKFKQGNTKSPMATS